MPKKEIIIRDKVVNQPYCLSMKHINRITTVVFKETNSFDVCAHKDT